jgi:DNA polymerase-3 subunit delta'
VLINGAQFLSMEAQNALLKALEEPPESTIFIMTATSETAILPTIASRAQRLSVLPVSLDEATKFLQSRFGKAKIESAWQLSQGFAGLLFALLQEDKTHPLKLAVDDAKRFLTMNRYERLLYLDKLSTNKAELLQFLDALKRILAVLHHNALKNNPSQSKRLAAGRRLAGAATDALSRNTSARLVGLELALQLPV